MENEFKIMTFAKDADPSRKPFLSANGLVFVDCMFPARSLIVPDSKDGEPNQYFGKFIESIFFRMK